MSNKTENPTQERKDGAVAKKTAIRTKFTPGTVIQVEDYELADLNAQGLIHSTELDDNWKPETVPDSDKTEKAAK